MNPIDVKLTAICTPTERRMKSKIVPPMPMVNDSMNIIPFQAPFLRFPFIVSRPPMLRFRLTEIPLFQGPGSSDDIAWDKESIAQIVRHDRN